MASLNEAHYDEWRGCVDEQKGNCPFMYLNQYDVECCNIDKIVQVRWYGCVPSVELAKRADKEEHQ